jgi:hypothetical protein
MRTAKTFALSAQHEKHVFTGEQPTEIQYPHPLTSLATLSRFTFRFYFSTTPSPYQPKAKSHIRLIVPDRVESSGAYVNLRGKVALSILPSLSVDVSRISKAQEVYYACRQDWLLGR